MEEFFMLCISISVFIVCILLAGIVGEILEREDLFEYWCTSQESVYEYIQEQHSCIKDNKVTPIDWYINRDK